MKLKNLDFVHASEARANEAFAATTGEPIGDEVHRERSSREILEDKLASNPNPFEFEPEDRQAERLDHLRNNVKEPLDKAKERIMGKNDLMSINYLQLGYLASFPVCRIHVKNLNGGSEGYGTGFLISPSLLITNNHVIEEHDFAVRSLAEFNYQYDEFGMPTESYLFQLKPEQFFKTNTYLDYTVVAVGPVGVNQTKKLADFGYLKLFAEPGKALITEHLTIIQHPGGDYKQIAIRENQLVEVKDDFVTYITDTAQGSSGSSVFNDQWQVVALHHSGVPRKNELGEWLKKDGTVWHEDEDDSLIDWIKNEGVRISSIVADLSNTHGETELFKEMVAAPVVMPKVAPEKNFFVDNGKTNAVDSPPINNEQPKAGNNEEINNMSDNQQNTITVTIPIEVTIKVGTAVAPSAGKTAIAPPPPETDASFLLKEAVNPNYNSRNGYSADFVKTNDFRIDLLDLLEGQISKLAPLKNPNGTNKYELKYFNFSVILNKFRKLCAITAVNIDGSKSKSLGREDTPWILDPRVDVKYQTGPGVYKNNDLDRGHMVRRLDPVWGSNAEAANDDTFHLTNSTPQHKNLNQKTWLSLEEYILKNADQENIRVSVFTGPIFGEEDIPYRGILLPLQFYKVAAMVKKDGKPSVTGYILSQPDEIDDFRDLEGIKDTGFGQFKTYQVPIRRIANLTGIRFEKFSQFDPLGNIDADELTDRIEIGAPEDIKL